MDITEHLLRIEEKLDYILEATGLEEINKHFEKSHPDQYTFPWYDSLAPAQETDVLK